MMRVAVAMSGGVDSSVAAALLRDRGWEVVGLSMNLGGPGAGGTDRRCCGGRDLLDARAVASRLGIPYYALDFHADFRREVLRPFADDYLRGRTPSPCILCNSELKFRRLQTAARRLGASHLATGHYARMMRDESSGRFRLFQGADRGKDQSYFLFNLGQEQLASLLLPLGDYTKAEVRRLAGEWRLPVAAKAESQDLCFAPSGDYRRVIQAVAPGRSRKPGDIVDRDGRVLGRHDGLEGFTVGQRRGLGVAAEAPLFVVALDPAGNRVIVGGRAEAGRRGLVADRVNWIPFPDPPARVEVEARIRSRHPGAAAVVRPGPGRTARVEFRSPQTGVAPGQAVVFFRRDEVLGGGWIREVY
ncbi:MAG: tRNA 2-thiouridine(34) synthase MnmA [Acidobacteria bacterium]|nr:tRNA 2-thiouridine(34) synthase MnmA [Acidobacteriota bacterium]